MGGKPSGKRPLHIPKNLMVDVLQQDDCAVTERDQTGAIDHAFRSNWVCSVAAENQLIIEQMGLVAMLFQARDLHPEAASPVSGLAACGLRRLQLRQGLFECRHAQE